ncbi:hypothetical protein M2451_002462 [Dysgonomonas sp. PFB1-18]|uniref:hypothetical protein n=1 Tax=unclassified Dysgonomonas TaxID=2630389 RepID=UPI002474F75B|nr:MULTISPECIES: hypothetical protein [unclassified Dysgonomonas]MDH6307229.1 hypothetical protein [Dysgonomonas sp. PF1-14]MDH6337147.1 hypothetical protein [Dysgonomonas sp. PF1-16]MDH6381133.1 hypothetical protein [Dysgonomonas sp. PFB1-18]MDH6396287.1 hypothetical protein [Dysgonomonas sp. PF1-23]
MKTIIKIIFILLLTLLFLGSDCNGKKESENCHNYYTFINNSDKKIRLSVSVSYPDSTILDGIGGTSDIVASNSRKKIKIDGCYEIDFELGIIYKHGVAMIFLFDEEIFKEYTFDEIRKNRMWLKKYDMRLEDFQRMNWTITYP